MMQGMTTRENNIIHKPKNKNDGNSIHRPMNEYTINMKKEKIGSELSQFSENEKSAI